MKPSILSAARISFPLATAIAALLAAPSVFAIDSATSAWTGTTSVTWATTTNWTPNTVPSATRGALFGSSFTGANQPQLNATGTAQGIHLADGATQNVTITGLTSARILNITGTAELGGQINAGIMLNDVTGTNNTLTIGNLVTTTLTNSTGFYVNSGGALTLNGTGTLNLNANTLTLAGTGALGTTSISQVISSETGAIIVNTSGTVTLSGTNTYGAAGTNYTTLTAGTLNLNNTRAVGDGTFTINGGKINTTNATAGLSVSNNAQIWGGNFEFVGTSNFSLGTGTVDLNAGTRTVTTTANTLTVGGIISNGALTKDGAGALLLQGANSYTGATTVNNGVLTVQNYSALDTTSGITVAGGSAILSLAVVGTGATSDTINKTLSLHGTLRTAGGTASNTLALTWDGNITLAGNSTINNHGNGSIDVNGQVDLAANTLTFQADQTGARIDGNIIGSGGLIKTGAQTLTITGANTYTGATNISTGSLTLGSTGALGTTPGVNGTIGITIGGASAATLTTSTDGITISAPITTANTGITSTIALGRSGAAASLTLNGAIGGNGNVIFTTPNVASGGNLQTIILGAAGTYAGNTTLSTGNINNNMTVRAGVTNALPSTTVLTMDGGNGPASTATRTITYELNGLNQTLGGLTNNTTRVQRNQRVNNASATTSTLTINNTADFSYGSTVVDAFTTTAAITGNLNLVKNGSGTQTLTGAANTFTGTTTVLGGILSLGHTGSLQNSAFDTANSITGTTVGGLRATVTTLTLGGLTGGNDFSTRFTTTTGGYDGLTALTLNPGTGVTNSYAGDIGDGATGMNLIKTGAGTQILTGTNTHTGSTTVSAGVLAVNGTLANTSTTTVSGTGTLKGSGSIASSVTINSGGTLASGTSIESLATGALSFNTGSNFEYELDKDVAATVAGDLTAVTGNLDLTGTVTLNLLETGTGAWELGSPVGDHFGSPAADKLTLISYTGTWNGGLFTYLGNLVQDDTSIMLNGQRWWFNYNDTDAGTNFTGDLTGSTFVTMTVPEPDAAAFLGGLGLLALFRRRRN